MRRDRADRHLRLDGDDPRGNAIRPREAAERVRRDGHLGQRPGPHQGRRAGSGLRRFWNRGRRRRRRRESQLDPGTTRTTTWLATTGWRPAAGVGRRQRLWGLLPRICRRPRVVGGPGGMAPLLGIRRHDLLLPTGDWCHDRLFYLFAGIAMVGGRVDDHQPQPRLRRPVVRRRDAVRLWAVPALLGPVPGRGGVIVYAGAIIVTFLFLIMLAQQAAGSAAYDQQVRQPLAATLAGFVVLGGVLCASNSGGIPPPVTGVGWPPRPAWPSSRRRAKPPAPRRPAAAPQLAQPAAPGREPGHRPRSGPDHVQRLSVRRRTGGDAAAGRRHRGHGDRAAHAPGRLADERLAQLPRGRRPCCSRREPSGSSAAAT